MKFATSSVFLLLMLVHATPLLGPATGFCQQETNSESDGYSNALYQNLIQTAESIAMEQSPSLDQMASFDRGWWQPLVSRSIRNTTNNVALSLDQVLYDALANSQQIQVFRQLPLIRETSVVEADSVFDWNAFIDAQWDDSSDPIGSTLTAGPGVSRFRDHKATGTAGLRKQTRTGGNVELSQRFGFQDNNSQFFVPGQQGTSRIQLNFTQPLMRGRGRWYNNSLICLAKIDLKMARDEFMRQLQSHLLEVARAYWAMYLERGLLYQKLRTYDRAKAIVERLRARRRIDASSSQIKAAEAALADRRSDLARAIAAVKNAEDRLRALVNCPSYGDYRNSELIPVDSPSFDAIPIDFEYSLGEATQQRPEIHQAIKRVKAASIRLGMAKHEIMPMLQLVTAVYVSGLAAEGDIAQAWESQFNQGEPGYSVGLNFEVPIHRRAARARRNRRQLELVQLKHQYENTFETVRLEVQVAVREIETAQRELVSKQQVVRARQEQLDQIVKRWERLPGADTSTSLILDNILRAQEDLSRAEFEYLQSQITYNLAHINLRKTTGTLFQFENANQQQSHNQELSTSTEQGVIVPATEITSHPK